MIFSVKSLHNPKHPLINCHSQMTSVHSLPHPQHPYFNHITAMASQFNHCLTANTLFSIIQQPNDICWLTTTPPMRIAIAKWHLFNHCHIKTASCVNHHCSRMTIQSLPHQNIMCSIIATPKRHPVLIHHCSRMTVQSLPHPNIILSSFITAAEWQFNHCNTQTSCCPHSSLQQNDS